jgi:putative hemolysin
MSSIDSAAPLLRTRDIACSGDFETWWNQTDVLLTPQGRERRYRVGYAASDKAVDLVQHLRYQVFNVELGEGLSASARDERDRDRFDAQMTHLVLLDAATGTIAGTYRMQTATQARAAQGLYCADYFDLEPLTPYFDQTVELGRACLNKEHRTLRAILTLWQGIGHFVQLFDQRYLVGCSSITTHDPDDGWRTMKSLRAQGYLHASMLLQPKPAVACGPAARELDPALGEALPLPKLFRTYLKLGARVISEPAIDRDFGTVDFLTFMDGREVTLSQLDVLN